MAPSRIQFEDLPEELTERLSAKVERLGYLGEFFQVAAHQPVALAHFIDLTEALKGALPDRLVEIIALTIATAAGNDYERVQHERLALKLGFDEGEVKALVSGAELDVRFSALERAVATLSLEVCLAQGAACPGFQQVEELGGPEQAVGCLMMASRYLAHATMSNTWNLVAPVPSPLAEVGSNA